MTFQTYKDKIKQLVEPVIESEEMELIDVECLKMKSRWVVRIYIDKEAGVTLDDCCKISNQVSDILDIHDVLLGSYSLEVSSPGLDRPLVRDKDFIKYRGHKVRVKVTEKLEGIKNFRGKLIDFCEEEGNKVLVVDTAGKVHRIPKKLVVKANIEYDFDADIGPR
ncbi:MAG: ribosome maturation factor RimP [Syntrophales bacterium]